jgi:hypothetical protein
MTAADPYAWDLTPPPCPRKIWGLPTGLPCLGSGPNHAHRYASAWAADRHTESEARDE